MYETFEETFLAKIVSDGDNIVRELDHRERPFSPNLATPQQTAEAYLVNHRDLLGIPDGALDHLRLPFRDQPGDEINGLRLLEEKTFFDLTTVAFQQTYFGLPVLLAAVAVHVKHAPMRVVAASSSLHTPMDAKRPRSRAASRFVGPSASKISLVLGDLLTQGDLDDEEASAVRSLEVMRTRMVVCRYDPGKRQRAVPNDRAADVPFAPFGPTLALRPVPHEIASGSHHVCAEIVFTFNHPRFGKLAWLAVVEVEWPVVLHLRAFTAGVDGMVFTADPLTLSGDPAKSTTASSVILNPCRTNVALEGLVPPVGGQQSLVGNYVALADYEVPNAAPPSRPVGAGFNFAARTDHFAAVNAYYHCDAFFRMIADMGFPVTSYFDGTTFPVPIDHRGHQLTSDGIEINAQCNGTGLGGIAEADFSLASLDNTAEPLGIATDRRLVLHELGGHGILYDHVNDVNFGFAHSAGDSIAAILSDPDSRAPDRSVTFPWFGARNHNRDVSGGWAWGGANDTGDQSQGDYNSEQILSTTHFRLYRSIGGDAARPEARRFAARFTTYLIVRAVGTLTSATNPNHVASYVTALLAADLGDWSSEGHSGGAYGKVIRWAFEKQGLYQSAGAPTPVTGEGDAPPVDVYIDDGRHGEYHYQANHWSCQAIWNRLIPDGGGAHQTPIVGQANYAYVKIKNRGTQIATDVVVRGYHCNPGAGLVWPNDWQSMTTAQLSAPDVAPDNLGEVVAGPFEWTPSQPDHECLLMIVSATGDPSNADLFAAGDSIPEWRLVPHDNNIGQRNVSPQPAAGGWATLLTAFMRRRFRLRNPHRQRARMEIVPVLPKLLTKLGWKMVFHSPGGRAFSLEPAQTKDVVMSLSAGGRFTAADVAEQVGRTIHVEAYADGILVGGMSYELDPELPAILTRGDWTS